MARARWSPLRGWPRSGASQIKICAVAVLGHLWEGRAHAWFLRTGTIADRGPLPGALECPRLAARTPIPVNRVRITPAAKALPSMAMEDCAVPTPFRYLASRFGGIDKCHTGRWLPTTLNIFHSRDRLPSKHANDTTSTPRISYLPCPRRVTFGGVLRKRTIELGVPILRPRIPEIEPASFTTRDLVTRQKASQTMDSPRKKIFIACLEAL